MALGNENNEKKNFSWHSLRLCRRFILLLLVFAGIAHAVPNPPLTHLNQLVKSAMQNNASLKSKKLAWQSLVQKYPQAIALNDPRISYSKAIRPIETRLGSQNHVLSLNQRIPYAGKLDLKGEIVWSEIKMAKIRYNKASRDLVVEIKKSFHELVYLENAIQLSLKNKTLLETINHISIADYASNTSTLNDVTKAQSQYAQVSYDVQLLQELRSTEKTRINTLLNRHPEQNFRINNFARKPAKLRHSLIRLYQWAERNEELSIADLAIEKSAVEKKLSKYTDLPDFDIGIRYNQIGSGLSGLSNINNDGLSVSISMNIPLNFEKNNAVKEQARLNQLKSIEDKKVIRHSLRNKIKGIYFKLNNSYRLITLYGDNLIPQANRAMQVAQLQYRQNKGSIANYLTTQSTWLNFQLAYQRAIADYAKNLAEMERLTGKAL
jgi:outer membrane protein TolC